MVFNARAAAHGGLELLCHYKEGGLSFPTYDTRADSWGTPEAQPLRAAGDGERHGCSARNQDSLAVGGLISTSWL